MMCVDAMRCEGCCPECKEDGERQTLIDAVANAHIGVWLSEQDALGLLQLLGMDVGEADDLLTAQREEASQP